MVDGTEVLVDGREGLVFGREVVDCGRKGRLMVGGEGNVSGWGEGEIGD